MLLLPGYDENSDPVILTARLVQARQLLESKNYPAAEQMAAAIPAASPLFEQSRLVAGEAATRSGRLTEALAYYDQIGSGTSSDAVLATYAAAEIYRSQCRLALAIAAYNRVLEFEPDNVAAHERLAFLLGVTRQIGKPRSITSPWCACELGRSTRWRYSPISKDLSSSQPLSSNVCVLLPTRP